MEAQAPTVDDGEPKVYIREELEAIADTKGIAGLRAIDDELNAKALGIPSLITAILNAQARLNFTPQVAESLTCVRPTLRVRKSPPP